MGHWRVVVLLHLYLQCFAPPIAVGLQAAASIIQKQRTGMDVHAECWMENGSCRGCYSACLSLGCSAVEGSESELCWCG